MNVPKHCCNQGHFLGRVPQPFRHVSRKQYRHQQQRFRPQTARCSLIIFDEDDIVVETALGSVSFMSVSSYAPDQGEGGVTMAGSNLDLGKIQRQGEQSLAPSSVKVRLYTGRIKRGPGGGKRIILKAYPSGSRSEADAMAANELAAHASLQPPTVVREPQHVTLLLGGFSPAFGATAGEQWLVFRKDGATTAGQWAQETAQSVSQSGFLAVFDRGKAQRQQAFVKEVLRQTMKGLAYIHSRNRLHQSLGPSSVILNTTDDSGGRPLIARLQDLAFSVDVSDAALYGGATLADIWEKGTIDARDPLQTTPVYGLQYICGEPPVQHALDEEEPQLREPQFSEALAKKQLAANLWRRADQEGARTQIERRNFGIADDVYAAGLLLAYMAFMPFCAPGSIDAPSLQRLLESTFRLDVKAAREYCEADERWLGAVAFMDNDGGAGWDLLGAMLCPQWRQRPTAESCLNHPFLKEVTP